MSSLIPKLEFQPNETIYVTEPPTDMGKPLLFKTLVVYLEKLVRPSLQIVLRKNLRIVLEPEKTRKTPLHIVHRDVRLFHRPTTTKTGRVSFEEYLDPHGKRCYLILHAGEILGCAEVYDAETELQLLRY